MLVPNYREQGQALCRPVCQPSSGPRQQELGLLGLSTLAFVSTGLLLKWPRIWMVGMGEAEYGKAGVNIVTLVVPSVPQRRSLASSMGIRGQLEGPSTWTGR